MVALKNSDQAKLDLLVRSRNKVIFNGLVKSVTSKNSKGEFDILGTHANFISLVQDKLVVIKEDGKQTEFSIGSGIMHVSSNKVQVYLGIRKQDDVSTILNLKV